MNRRDFLHPRTGHAPATSSAPWTIRRRPTASAATTALLRLSRRAMATTFEIVLPFDSDAALAHGRGRLRSARRARRPADRLPRAQRGLPAQPHRLPRAVPVERGLFDLLQTAARITAGDGRGLRRDGRGAHQGVGLLPRAAARAVRRRTGSGAGTGRHATRGAGRGAADGRVPPAGLEINLGTIGKGYALDRVGEFLAATGKFPAVLLHGGHSSVYARGSPNDDPRGWPVGISPPLGTRPAPGRGVAARPGAGRPRRPRSSTWNTTAASSATSSTRAPAGRPRAWPAPRSSPRPAPRPTPCRRPSTSAASRLARRYCAAHPEVGAVLLPEGDGAEPGRSLEPRSSESEQ